MEDEPSNSRAATSLPRPTERAASCSSSSSSSYIDISRHYPANRPKGLAGILSFFTTPAEHRHRRRRKRRLAILGKGNSSSSSINSDLAYGTGFIRRRKSENARGKRREREPGLRRSPRTVVDDDAEIQRIGAGLAEVARKQNKLDLKERRRLEEGRSPGLTTSRGLGSSKPSHGPDDDGWESASDAESESSSVDSRLAYGGHTATGGGWGIGFGKPKPKRKDSVVDPKLFGPQNSLLGVLEGPVGFHDDMVDHSDLSDFAPPTVARVQSLEMGQTRPDATPSNPSRAQSMQYVYPVPTSDPDRFDVGRNSTVAEPAPYTSRAGPVPVTTADVPIRQPQPIVPVTQNIYNSSYPAVAGPSDSVASSRNKPARSSIAGAALVGVSGAIAAASAFSGRVRDRREGEDDERQRRRRERRPDETEEERAIRRERRRNETDAEREERRARRREERDREQGYGRPEEYEHRDDRRRDGAYSGPRDRDSYGTAKRSEPRSKEDEYRSPIDPFQFQVPDDAFKTPDGTKDADPIPELQRARSPAIITVDRVPKWHREETEAKAETKSGSSAATGDESSRGRSKERETAAESIYKETEQFTAPIEAGAVGVAVALVTSEEKEDKASKRRFKKRSRDSEDKKRSRSSSTGAEGSEQDPIQAEADRIYRETVLARKIASSQGGEDPVPRVVTPPEMSHKKKPSPYDAPNADFELDKVMEPHEFVPGSTDRDIKAPLSKDLRRPLMTLVRPTPTPSPAPGKRQSRPESPERARETEPSKTDEATVMPQGQATEPPGSRTIIAGESKVEQPEETTQRTAPAEVPMIPTAAPASVPLTKVGNAEAPTSVGGAPRSVTWGANETRRYVVESPYETKDDPIATFAGSSEEQEKSKMSTERKASAWGAVKGAFVSGAAAATVAAATESSGKEKSAWKDSSRQDRGPPSDKRPIVEPAAIKYGPIDQGPPPVGPKPQSPAAKSSSQHMPGSFDDDLDFTATLAAGLQNTGFDPEIVIKDPLYRRRSSPPGTNDDSPLANYKQPWAETVSDLGQVHAGSGSDKDFRAVIDKREYSPPSKEQRRREKRGKRASRGSPDSDKYEDATSTVAVVTEPGPESEFRPSTTAKTERKSREPLAESNGYGDEGRERRDKRVSVPVDAYDDRQSEFASTATATDEWPEVKEPKRKSKSKKQDDWDYDVSSQSKITAEVAPFTEQSPTGRSKDQSKDQSKQDSDDAKPTSRSRSASEPMPPANELSSKKSKRRSEQYGVETLPEDVALPTPTASEFSKDDQDLDKKSKKSSKRDSMTFSDTADTRSVVSEPFGDDDYDTKRSKKSSKRDIDTSDTRSIASEPMRDDDYDSRRSKNSGKRDADGTESRSSKSSSRKDDVDTSKKDKKGGFFGLIGSNKSDTKSDSKSDKKSDRDSKSDTRSEPDRSKDTEEDHDARRKDKKAHKRRSTGDDTELARTDSKRSSLSHEYDWRDGGDDDPTHPTNGHTKDDLKAEDAGHFLGNAGILGAGAGVVAAAAIAAQQLRSKASPTDVEASSSARLGSREVTDSRASWAAVPDDTDRETTSAFTGVTEKGIEGPADAPNDEDDLWSTTSKKDKKGKKKGDKDKKRSTAVATDAELASLEAELNKSKKSSRKDKKSKDKDKKNRSSKSTSGVVTPKSENLPEQVGREVHEEPGRELQLESPTTAVYTAPSVQSREPEPAVDMQTGPVVETSLTEVARPASSDVSYKPALSLSTGEPFKLAEEPFSVPSKQLTEPELVDPEIVQRKVRIAIDPEWHDLLPLPPSGPGSPNKEQVMKLPALPPSPTGDEVLQEVVSPRERYTTPSRRHDQTTPVKARSQSAVPIAFLLKGRATPSSPQSPVAGDSPTRLLDSITPQTKKSRPISWESSKGLRPLSLVAARRDSVGSVGSPSTPKGHQRSSSDLPGSFPGHFVGAEPGAVVERPPVTTAIPKSTSPDHLEPLPSPESPLQRRRETETKSPLPEQSPFLPSQAEPDQSLYPQEHHDGAIESSLPSRQTLTEKEPVMEAEKPKDSLQELPARPESKLPISMEVESAHTSQEPDRPRENLAGAVPPESIKAPLHTETGQFGNTHISNLSDNVPTFTTSETPMANEEKGDGEHAGKSPLPTPLPSVPGTWILTPLEEDGPSRIVQHSPAEITTKGKSKKRSRDAKQRPLLVDSRKGKRDEETMPPEDLSRLVQVDDDHHGKDLESSFLEQLPALPESPLSTRHEEEHELTPSRKCSKTIPSLKSSEEEPTPPALHGLDDGDRFHVPGELPAATPLAEVLEPSFTSAPSKEPSLKGSVAQSPTLDDEGRFHMPGELPAATPLGEIEERSLAESASKQVPSGESANESSELEDQVEDAAEQSMPGDFPDMPIVTNTAPKLQTITLDNDLKSPIRPIVAIPLPPRPADEEKAIEQRIATVAAETPLPPSSALEAEALGPPVVRIDADTVPVVEDDERELSGATVPGHFPLTPLTEDRGIAEPQPEPSQHYANRDEDTSTHQSSEMIAADTPLPPVTVEENELLVLPRTESGVESATLDEQKTTVQAKPPFAPESPSHPRVKDQQPLPELVDQTIREIAAETPLPPVTTGEEEGLEQSVNPNEVQTPAASKATDDNLPEPTTGEAGTEPSGIWDEVPSKKSKKDKKKDKKRGKAAKEFDEEPVSGTPALASEAERVTSADTSTLPEILPEIVQIPDVSQESVGGMDDSQSQSRTEDAAAPPVDDWFDFAPSKKFKKDKKKDKKRGKAVVDVVEDSATSTPMPASEAERDVVEEPEQQMPGDGGGDLVVHNSQPPVQEAVATPEAIWDDEPSKKSNKDKKKDKKRGMAAPTVEETSSASDPTTTLERDLDDQQEPLALPSTVPLPETPKDNFSAREVTQLPLSSVEAPSSSTEVTEKFSLKKSKKDKKKDKKRGKATFNVQDDSRSPMAPSAEQDGYAKDSLEPEDPSKEPASGAEIWPAQSSFEDGVAAVRATQAAEPMVIWDGATAAAADMWDDLSSTKSKKDKKGDIERGNAILVVEDHSASLMAPPSEPDVQTKDNLESENTSKEAHSSAEISPAATSSEDAVGPMEATRAPEEPLDVGDGPTTAAADIWDELPSKKSKKEQKKDKKRGKVVLDEPEELSSSMPEETRDLGKPPVEEEAPADFDFVPKLSKKDQKKAKKAAKGKGQSAVNDDQEGQSSTSFLTAAAATVAAAATSVAAAVGLSKQQDEPVAPPEQNVHQEAEETAAKEVDALAKEQAKALARLHGEPEAETSTRQQGEEVTAAEPKAPIDAGLASDEADLIAHDQAEKPAPREKVSTTKEVARLEPREVATNQAHGPRQSHEEAEAAARAKVRQDAKDLSARIRAGREARESEALEEKRKEEVAATAKARRETEEAAAKQKAQREAEEVAAKEAEMRAKEHEEEETAAREKVRRDVEEIAARVRADQEADQARAIAEKHKEEATAARERAEREAEEVAAMAMALKRAHADASAQKEAAAEAEARAKQAAKEEIKAAAEVEASVHRHGKSTATAERSLVLAEAEGRHLSKDDDNQSEIDASPQSWEASHSSDDQVSRDVPIAGRGKKRPTTKAEQDSALAIAKAKPLPMDDIEPLEVNGRTQAREKPTVESERDRTLAMAKEVPLPADNDEQLKAIIGPDDSGKRHRGQEVYIPPQDAVPAFMAASVRRLDDTESNVDHAVSDKEVRKSRRGQELYVPSASPLPVVLEEESPNIDKSQVERGLSPLDHARSETPYKDTNRDSGLVVTPIPFQGRFNDQERTRDSGVHLGDAPLEKSRSSAAASDDAITRMSWPVVDEESETVHLHSPQHAKPGESSGPLSAGIALTAAAAPASRGATPHGASHTANRTLRRSTPTDLEPIKIDRTRSPGVVRLNTPEHIKIRPVSAGSSRSSNLSLSNTSSTTPPLRRTDRRRSGDLRSLSQRSQPNLAKQAHDARDVTVERSPATSNVSSTPIANEGRVRLKDMADVYVSWNFQYSLLMSNMIDEI